MALTFGATLANWGIAGVSVVPITFVTTCESVSATYRPPQFFFVGAMKTQSRNGNGKWPG